MLICDRSLVNHSHSLIGACGLLSNNFVSLLFSNWLPPDNKHISVAVCNAFQIVVALGKEIIYLEVLDGSINQIRSNNFLFYFLLLF